MPARSNCDSRGLSKNVATSEELNEVESIVNCGYDIVQSCDVLAHEIAHLDRDKHFVFVLFVDIDNDLLLAYVPFCFFNLLTIYICACFELST